MNKTAPESTPSSLTTTSLILKELEDRLRQSLALRIQNVREPPLAETSNAKITYDHLNTLAGQHVITSGTVGETTLSLVLQPAAGEDNITVSASGLNLTQANTVSTGSFMTFVVNA